MNGRGTGKAAENTITEGAAMNPNTRGKLVVLATLGLVVLSATEAWA